MANEMWLKVRTRGNAKPQGKSRVYFSCHPEDREKYFDTTCEQILGINDCAIYYTEDTGLSYSDENWETDLGQMNLFVMPVTFKLLRGGNRSLDTDLKFANEKHIPVLPLMMEPGLTELFTEKFGNIQYLDPNSFDETAISFDEKLKTYLDSVLIGDEMRRRVQAEFEDYIFLSYRKKDRKYANELMRLIHKRYMYRDIAIWYDEFLTPGEDYNENINSAFKKSKFIVLLVTPNLLEDPNYVMTTEYPMALEQKKRVIPIEMFNTDYEQLKDKYEGLPHLVKCCDDDSFWEQLDDVFLRETGVYFLLIERTEAEEAEHSFLMGIAYLEGIDVEKNNGYALELITRAAEAELPEAMEKLANMYHDGIAVERDWNKWVEWLEKLVVWTEKEYGEDNEKVLKKWNNLADAYIRMGKAAEALKLEKKVYARWKEKLGEEHPSTLKTLGNMASTYGKLGEYKKMFEIERQVYTSKKKVLGEEHPDTLITLNNMASTYGKLGEHHKAIELNKQVYESRKKVLGKDHPDTLTTLNNIAVTYGNIGEYKKAFEMETQVYTNLRKILGENHPSTLTTLGNVASLHGYLGEHQKALELKKQVYERQKKVLGEGHPKTLITLSNITSTYVALGDYQKALELEKQVYERQKKVLGEDHPDTLTTLKNMAIAYGKLGEHLKELEYREQLYDIRKKTLGEEHPDTLKALSDVVVTYGKLGEHQKALDINKQLYESRKRVLGEEHPDTLKVLFNMVTAYENLDEYQKALELAEQLYERRKKVLGKDHPNTLATLHDMAWCYGEMGEKNKALTLFIQAFAGRKEVLGLSNKFTVSSCAWVAYYYNVLGDSKAAIALCDEIFDLPEAELSDKPAERIALIYEQHGQNDKASKIRERIKK